jgi:hypothetical protein
MEKKTIPIKYYPLDATLQGTLGEQFAYEGCSVHIPATFSGGTKVFMQTRHRDKNMIRCIINHLGIDMFRAAKY